jgi:outer membrane protein assembly factor BamB
MVGDDDNTIPPSPLIDFIETAKVSRLWSDDVGSGTNELFIKLIPAVMGEQVFIADTEGDMEALDASSGKRIWDKDIKLPITGGPGADLSMVLVGSSEGDVVSLNPDTGEEIWRSKVSSEILSSPRESEKVVIVRTIDGKIFALRSETGERLWVYDRTVPALTLRGTSTPVISGDRVIAGFDGGRVTSLDLSNGKLNWETRVAISRGRSELERMVDIDAQPLIYQDAIFVATYQSIIAALALETGSVLWEREISSYTELSADGGYLYVTDDLGNVWALDRFSGSSIWKQEKLQHRRPTGPAIIGDKAVVGDVEGYLHWMDKHTGEFVARVKVSDSPVLVKPTVKNDTLFAYASDGTLAAYQYIDKDASKIPARPVETKTETTAEQNETSAELVEEEKSFFDILRGMIGGDEVDDDE